MCGIAGIIGGSGDYSANLACMLHAMAHRGPDGQGAITFEGGAAGAVRLALVDLSDRGRQPIWSSDHRVAILFNGEIYNHAEERARLAAAGYRFFSAADTEVVLALYLERGLDFVDRLRGMFALAILDWRETSPGGRPTLILARDHFGIKPLYVYQSHGGPLLFASEVRTLLASGLVPAQIDVDALVDYLAIGFILQPRTILSGVRMFDRGSILRYTPDGRVELRTFWSLPPAEPRRETLDQAAERLRAVLEESVRLHAMADAPVGAFLSGGVDSSGVVSLMARRNPRLRTYTILLPDVLGWDEAPQAASLARSLGCEHTNVEVTGREVRDLVPRFAAEIDQPTTDGLNTWLISRAAARDVKGVLSGLGGDEWFAGYPVTRRIAGYRSGRGRLHLAAGKFATLTCDFVPPSRLRRKLDDIAPRGSLVATWIHDHRVFGYPLAHRLAGAAAADSGASRVLSLAGPGWHRESSLGLCCLLDVNAYMGCQLLRDSDAVSMASSLELRVPLVDVRIAEFARSCADEFKLGLDGGAGPEYGASGAKAVLIRALRDVLPADILQRPKRGFALPHHHWTSHDLASLVEETCSRETIAARGLLDPDLLPDHLDGWPHFWSLLILELWCRAALDSRPASSPMPESLQPSHP